MSRGSGAGRTLQSATVFKLSEVARLQHLWLRAVFPHKSGKFTISLSVSLSLSIYIIYICTYSGACFYYIVSSNQMFKSHPISSYLHMIYIFYIWLEVLNNLKIWKSDWIIIPTIGEKKTCSKPPTKCYINYINPSKNQLHISCLHHIYLGRLKYFTNLNLAAIWWWVPL